MSRRHESENFLYRTSTDAISSPPTLESQGYLTTVYPFITYKENLASAKPTGADGRLSCTDALAMDGRVSL